MNKRRKQTWTHSTLLILILLLSIMCMVLIGCGNSDDDDDDDGAPPEPAQIVSGVFVDSAVSGLNYSTETLCDTTDADGVFKYAEGETVTFSIGDLILGSAPGAELLSPIDIVPGAADANDQRVTNICVLLQTLDQDGKLNNGIQITAEIADMVSIFADRISFDQSPAEFAADRYVSALLAALNDTPGCFADTDPRLRPLRKAGTAVEHLQNSLGDRITVSTNYGDLRGFAATDTTWAWYGVPYAKPPIGDLRWRAPVAPDAWDGIREAVQWGDQAAQNPSYEAYAEGGMSEDCLYLNITAPRDAEDLPVMVWFHGGGFVILTGNTRSYNNPTSLPTKDVVLVTVNHRLGPFGYLAHPDLTEEAQGASTGNFGQLDLIAALQWIEENIAYFGGNPDNVTIFGESGGGGKSISLMASPMAVGLFDQVICESGTAHSEMTVLNGLPMDTAYGYSADLMDRLGVATIDELRNVSWTKIIESENIAYDGDYKDIYGPVIDGVYMDAPLGDLIQGGLASNVPIIVGINSADMPGLGRGMAEQMPWRYENNDAPQYTYIFTHVPQNWAAKGVGAYHGIELVYVFNYKDSFFTHYLFGLTGIDEDPDTEGAQVTPQGFYANATGYADADIALTDTVMTMWTNFARTGDPSIPGAVQWNEYTPDGGGNYLEISAAGQEMKTGLEERILTEIDPETTSE